MSKGFRGRLSYANVTATLALFIALGGSAYAAFKLPKNSVGSSQIKAGAVKNAKLAAGAVTARKVASGSLTGAQVNASTLGTVPNSRHALSADSADKLGGVSARRYLTKAGLASISVAADGKTKASRGGASVQASDIDGHYCIRLSFRPAGGAITLDQADAGLPLAYLTLDPTKVADGGCPGQALVQTYADTGAGTREGFFAMFY